MSSAISSGAVATGLVQQFVERTGQLYSLPAVAMEVLRLTSEETVDARQLKECIERDPALTTRILRVANSSLFGPARPVTDLAQALALLGTRPLRMLVLGFSLPKELFSGVAAEVLAQYWRHTLIKAVAARELAERVWRAPGDDAFTAALVQDVGQLALIQQLGDSYIQFLSEVQTRGGGLLAQELETLGFDHVVLSARLLGRWGLPPALVAAISHPPSEEQIAALPAAERQMPQILHLAELLARLIEQPFGSALADLLAIGSRYRGLTYEQLQPLTGKLQTQVTELADVLSLELPGEANYVDLLLTARERLAEETAGAAAMLAVTTPEEALLTAARRLQTELAAACNRPSPKATTIADNAGGANGMELPGAAGANARYGSALTLTKPAIAAPVRYAAALENETLQDAGLPGLVSGAVGRCRAARCPVTLALVEIDEYSNLLLQLGPTPTSELVHWLRLGLADWTGQRVPVSLVGDACFALLWEDCSRSDAVRAMRQALVDAKHWWELRSTTRCELTLSAGLATLEFPPRNFPARQLIDAARRCLSGAQLSGGDTLKSIVF
jgi:HD-like signal output (HDOD) protein